jgi:hypothetical protein
LFGRLVVLLFRRPKNNAAIPNTRIIAAIIQSSYVCARRTFKVVVIVNVAVLVKVNRTVEVDVEVDLEEERLEFVNC